MRVDERFEAAAGSVMGRSHALAGRCNQDAFAVRSEPHGFCGVVCDGCGSGGRSEVGAVLGAQIIVEQAIAEMERGAAIDDAATWERIRTETLDVLRNVVRAMGGKTAHVVAECFLFTVLGVAISREKAAIFGVGDGIVAFGADIIRLGPYPGNAPPYLGYGLLGEGPAIEVFQSCGIDDFDSALVGTDGAADYASLEGTAIPGQRGDTVLPLRSFWETDLFFRNTDAIRRTLWLVNREVTRPLWNERRMAREPGLLEDDTTVLVVRKKRMPAV